MIRIYEKSERILQMDAVSERMISAVGNCVVKIVIAEPFLCGYTEVVEDCAKRQRVRVFLNVKRALGRNNGKCLAEMSTGEKKN